MVSPLYRGVQSDVHSTAFGPLAVGTTGFHGFLMMPPSAATRVPTPNAPRPMPAAIPIILRRLIVELSNASTRVAAEVLRSISGERPSWRSWIEISSGMNRFWYRTAPTPMARMDSPKVIPYIGVAQEYSRLPLTPYGLYSQGQNRKTSSSSRPITPPNSSQNATRRSDRFSARVPGTGQRSSLKTVSTPSIRPPRAASSDSDIAERFSPCGLLDSLMTVPRSTSRRRWRPRFR